uniref:CSab-Lyc-5 n=1 Tax=Lychas buchari TaxID=1330406 RepID=T1DPB9_9SCOR
MKNIVVLLAVAVLFNLLRKSLGIVFSGKYPLNRNNLKYDCSTNGYNPYCETICKLHNTKTGFCQYNSCFCEKMTEENVKFLAGIKDMCDKRLDELS